MNQRRPLTLVVPAAACIGLLVVPLLAIVVRAPWHGVPHLLSRPAAWTALRLSLECSFAALGLSLVVGVPLAWVLARCEFPGRSLVRTLVLVPLVLPPVVGGIALLLAFGRDGLVPLDLSFTTRAAVLAETFVALPFLVLAVEGALLALDRDIEEVAATLGAGPVRTFVRVTLPLVGPALAAGAALAWARALGEFGATVTFAGSLPGRTQTLPLAIYLQLQSDPDAAVAMSLLLLAVSLVVLVTLRRRWRVAR